jgi:dihydrofolate synthase/folylpolyglutamate synthase
MCSTLKDTNTLPPKDTIEWLYSFDKYGWVFGLDRIRFLLEQVGNPQDSLKIIHVAGTNGKGSVCQYISSVLEKAGYTVGEYLSPHIERFSERITINNKEISDDDLARLIMQVRPFVEKMMQQNNTPTFFEIVTVLACLYFKERAVDFSVVEVGLGGRLDATNVVHPLVSVITNISLEHTDILGKDAASIASEKAGIIKENIAVITAAKHDAFDVIQRTARERNAPILCIDQTMWKRICFQWKYQEFLIHGSFKDYTVRTSLLGQHQGENITVAIAVIERLQMNGLYITDNDIIEGIAAASHPGRMELVSDNPLILLDGAHNPAGVHMLVETLQQDFSTHRLILVLGVLKDKDIRSMLAAVVPIAEVVIVTKTKVLRAADPEMLKQDILKLNANKTVLVHPSVPDAIDHARNIARQNDLICVTGSLFTVGEARSYLLSRKIVS